MKVSTATVETDQLNAFECPVCPVVGPRVGGLEGCDRGVQLDAYEPCLSAGWRGFIEQKGRHDQDLPGETVFPNRLGSRGVGQ
jgi:hypothetical protein